MRKMIARFTLRACVFTAVALAFALSAYLGNPKNLHAQPTLISITSNMLIEVEEKQNTEEPCKLLKVQAWGIKTLTPKMLDRTGKPHPNFSASFGGQMRKRADGDRPDYSCSEIWKKGDNDTLGINTGEITRSMASRTVTITLQGKSYETKTVGGIAYFYFNGTPPDFEIRISGKVIAPEYSVGIFKKNEWKKDPGGVMSFSFVVEE